MCGLAGISRRGISGRPG